jgi:hypothetical protein
MRSIAAVLPRQLCPLLYDWRFAMIAVDHPLLGQLDRIGRRYGSSSVFRRSLSVAAVLRAVLTWSGRVVILLLIVSLHATLRRRRGMIGCRIAEAMNGVRYRIVAGRFRLVLVR